ncbi:hypothetical protein GCM10023184_43480 [Flaviaesturariibacter amylovorans]|uniref:Uncharacterized protein n=1 Tax=Flaviaesturariibacter amylovorans TaxID=1084520 RepID=A0ABP8HRQ6_9BACT
MRRGAKKQLPPVYCAATGSIRQWARNVLQEARPESRGVHQCGYELREDSHGQAKAIATAMAPAPTVSPAYTSKGL